MRNQGIRSHVLIKFAWNTPLPMLVGFSLTAGSLTCNIENQPHRMGHGQHSTRKQAWASGIWYRLYKRLPRSGECQKILVSLPGPVLIFTKFTSLIWYRNCLHSLVAAGVTCHNIWSKFSSITIISSSKPQTMNVWLSCQVCNLMLFHTGTGYDTLVP